MSTDYGSTDLHKTLYDLGHATNSSDFQTKISRLSQKDSKETLSTLLEENQDLFTKDDISSLFHLKDNVIKYLSPQSSTQEVTTITNICHKLLARTDSSIRSQMMAANFPANSLDERVYISDLLEKLSNEEQTKLLKLMQLIPSSQRSFETVEYLVDLIQHNKEDKELLPTIALILEESSPKEIADIINAACLLLKGTENNVFVSDIFLIMSTIQSDQRSDVIDKCFSLISNLKTIGDRTLIVEAVSKIKQEDRENVIRASTPLFEGLTKGSEIAAILHAVNKIPLDRRSKHIELSQQFIQGVRGLEKADILNKISNFLDNSGEAALKTITPLIISVQNPRERAVFLHEMALIPFDELQEVINLANPLIQDISIIYQRSSLIHQVSQIASFERKNVIDNALPILEGITDGYQKSQLLNAIQKIPQEERAEIVSMARPLIRQEWTVEQIAEILHMLTQISSEQRQDAIQKSLPLIKDVQTGIADIIYAVGQINPENRQIVIENAQRLITNIHSGETRAFILRSIDALPGENRSYILGRSIPLLKDITNGEHIGEMLITISGIKQEDFDEVIDRATPLVHLTTNGWNRKKILEAIATTPKELRSLLTEKADKVIQTMPENAGAILEVIKYFPLEEIDTILDALLQGPHQAFTGPMSVVDYIFRTHFAIVPKVHDHIRRLLTIIKNPKEAEELAQDIILNDTHFFLQDNAPLFKDAVKILGARSITFPQDPYKVYLNLQEIESLPLPSIDLSNQLIEGRHVSLNLKTFQENARIRKIKYEELPKGMTPEQLRAYFENIENRFSQLNYDDQIRAEESVVRRTSDSLATLKFNFASDAYIRTLMSITAKKGDFVSDESARLFAIMQFIESKSNEFESEKAFLTPREQVLLSMSASIQACPTGKSEGIALAYNTLPQEFKYSQEKKAEVPEIERALSYIDTMVQQNLNDALSSENALMLEMTQGSPPINQLAHQTLYLKNSIGSAIGLKHEVKFDHYTTVISQDLFDRSREENIQIFYKHYTPKILIDALKISVDRDISDKKTLYTDLNRILPPSTELAKCWALSTEDYMTLTLTDYGARELLIASKYLQ